LKLCRQLLAAPLTDLLPRPTDYRDFYAALTGKNLKRLCRRNPMKPISITRFAFPGTLSKQNKMPPSRPVRPPPPC
jgi:hypothetical protein